MIEYHVTLFLRQNVSDPALVADPAKDAQFKEIAVDEMRARKDEVPVTSLLLFTSNIVFGVHVQE